jgi:hypothetical protein
MEGRRIKFTVPSNFLEEKEERKKTEKRQQKAE